MGAKIDTQDKEKLPPEGFENLNLGELEENIFSMGDIYWRKISGKNILLFKTGELADIKKIHKMLEKGQQLIIKRLTTCYQSKRLFQAISLLSKESDAREIEIIRLKVLSIFRDLFWIGNGEGEIVELQSFGRRTFFSLPASFDKSLQSVGIDIYNRNHMMAGVGVLLAMVMGYSRFEFLQDFYHSLLLVDYRPSGKAIGFFSVEAMKKEFHHAGSGLKHLGPYPFESIIFEKHSKVEFKEEIQKIFNDPSVLMVIEKHHELMNGLGFNHLHEDVLSDLECILIFVHGLFEVGEMSFKKNDGKMFIKNSLENCKRENELLSLRLKNMLKHILEGLPNIEEESEDLVA